MKKIFIILIALMPSILSAQISINDIQYTTNAGDGTYPSIYNDQSVTTGGIVTANNFSGGRYFISSSKGGAWNGLFVYDNNYSPAIGDSILITGTVAEYNGYTEIKDLTAYSVISSGNILPTATSISTSDVTSEAYEGVFVQVNDCNVTSVFDQYNNWEVDDGSGECEVRPVIYDLSIDFELFTGYSFNYIKGVVGLSYGVQCLSPRFIDDFQSANNEYILSTNDKFVESDVSFSYPIKISILNQTNAISSYSLKMQYDQTKFEYQGFSKTGTISETGSITDDSSIGNIELNFSGSINSDNTSILVYLNFQPLAEGNANLEFNSPTINGSVISYLSIGDLEYASDLCDIPRADTLTIVQRPLPNIPSIVIPQQQMDIECFAPENTTDWVVELFYKNVSFSVPVDQASYDSDLDKWTLTTTIPNVDLYELYDMRVSASGGLTDEVKHAVKVIDQYKDDYYFIHITDTHLPGHTFYGESGYDTDESEMDDLYEVIKDINILNPEFVLLTGDLINEGELEDFECLRNHTLAVKLLEKLEVPVYLVPGNHDLGGWDATPPPQGTARREWWRFFGYRQREIPPTKVEYLSHDYSFDYGNTHFIGLEAYDNYDGYMYDVYGNESFISSQLTWLNNDIAAAGDKTKVLFYHYDFKKELDLYDLGVDMALWGHTHKNLEDATHPYNISTASTCDGNRTYRVIRVNNNILKAEVPIQTNSSGDMLRLEFNMINNGSLDSISAIIQNKFKQTFNNGVIKFLMPVSDDGYKVTNGVLEQTIEFDNYVLCYVKVNILNSDEIIVSIVKGGGNATGISDLKQSIIKTYPNPFKDLVNIEIEIKKEGRINLSIFDSVGRLVDVLVDKKMQPGIFHFKWDANNSIENKVDSGIYFCRGTINGEMMSSKQIIYMK